MLFFVLSGFLMAYLYMSQTSNQRTIKKYAIARFARVVPLYLLIVLLSYALHRAGIHNVLYKMPSSEMLIAHLLTIKGISVLWTIGPELQFYVVFLALWWLAAKREGLVYVIMAASLVGLCFLDFPRYKGVIVGLTYDIALLQSLPYFFTGVVFGRLYATQSLAIPVYLRSGWFIATLLLIPLMYPVIFSSITGARHGMWSELAVLLIIALIFFSILFLVPDNNKLMNNAAGDFFGKISYSLYLLHLPVLWQVHRLEISHHGLMLVVFITCAIAVSYFSYRFIERPCANYIRSFEHGRS